MSDKSEASGGERQPDQQLRQQSIETNKGDVGLVFRPAIKQQSEPIAEADEDSDEEGDIHPDLGYIDRSLLKASQNKLDTLKSNNYHTWASAHNCSWKKEAFDVLCQDHSLSRNNPEMRL